jgi:hypothetical protein
MLPLIPAISACDSADPRETVEISIETEDPCHALSFHHGDVQSIAGRKPRRSQEDGLCPFDRLQVHGEDFVDDSQQSVEGRLNRIRSTDGHVTVEDLLQHLGIGDKPLPLGQAPFEESLRVGLAGVWRAD